MKDKSFSLKQTLIVVLLTALLCVGLTSTYYILASPGEVTVEPLSFTSPASYIIGIDGSTIYARNGKTGAIDYSGTDASTVIQSAINALTSGGKIFIKEGTYSLTSALSFSYPINFEGENKNSVILKWAGSANEIIIKLNSQSYDTTMVFRDFSINGSDTSGIIGIAPISGYNARFKFENLQISDCDIGIRTADPDDSSNYGTANHKRLFTSVFDNVRLINNRVGVYINEFGYTFVQCNLGGNTDYGILINDQATAVFDGTVWSYNGLDVYMEKSGTKTIGLVFNEVWMENSNNGCFKATGTYTKITHSIIFNSGHFHTLSTTDLLNFTEIDGNIILSGVYLRPNSPFSTIGDVLVFTYHRTRVIGGFYWDGSTTKFLANSGSVTLNVGENSKAVTHNLLKAPRHVWITQITGDILATRIGSINATHFTIYTNSSVTANSSWNWYAEV